MKKYSSRSATCATRKSHYFVENLIYPHRILALLKPSPATSVQTITWKPRRTAISARINFPLIPSQTFKEKFLFSLSSSNFFHLFNVNSLLSYLYNVALRCEDMRHDPTHVSYRHLFSYCLLFFLYTK